MALARLQDAGTKTVACPRLRIAPLAPVKEAGIRCRLDHSLKPVTFQTPLGEHVDLAIVQGWILATRPFPEFFDARVILALEGPALGSNGERHRGELFDRGHARPLCGPGGFLPVQN